MTPAKSAKLKIKPLKAQAVLRIRGRIRIRMFMGLQDPDPLVRGTDPHPSIVMQKIVRKTLILEIFCKRLEGH
jgi:hypothetical protein